MVRRGAALLASVAVLSACNEFDRLDAACSPDSPSIDEDPGCIRADGKGPKVANECEPLQEEPGSDPTWEEVAEVLTDEARGGCTQSGSRCHSELDGGTSGIHLPPTTGVDLYDALRGAFGKVGRPYVVPGDPASSWMHCNVRGTDFDAAGVVGKRMPEVSGLPDPADVYLIEDWVLQGARGPE